MLLLNISFEIEFRIDNLEDGAAVLQILIKYTRKCKKVKKEVWLRLYDRTAQLWEPTQN